MARRILIDDPLVFEHALKALRRGELIVYPTDTLYGLGVDATNDRAIDRLNELKGRTSPLSVVAPDIPTALGWTTLKKNLYQLVENKLRESNTVIVPVRPGIVNEKVLGPGYTLGIRVPRHPFPSRLAMRFGNPITTTSVNRSGQPPLNDPETILLEFGSEIALVVAAGPLPPSPGSTIYQVRQNRLIRIRP